MSYALLCECGRVCKNKTGLKLHQKKCKVVLDAKEKEVEEQESKKQEEMQPWDINERIGFLSNVNNSCYIDSALMAIFHRPLTWIQTNLLQKTGVDEQLHEELQRICDHIQNKTNDVYNVTALRDIFHRLAPNSRDIDWLDGEQDPYDVFDLLSDLYKFPSDVKYKIESNIHDSRLEDRCLTALILDSHQLRRKALTQTYIAIRMNIPEHIESVNTDTESFVEKSTMISADLFMVRVERLSYGDIKNYTVVVPEESIEVNKTPLHCVSIILHHGSVAGGGHYTCMIRAVDDVWYHYNDMNRGNKFVKIGSWDDLMHFGVVKCLTTLLYSKL
jgi:hypothetical protein